MRQKIRQRRDFPGGPVVKTSASNAEGAGLMPGQGGKIPPCSVAKKKKPRSNIVTSSMKTLMEKNTKKQLKKISVLRAQGAVINKK